MTARVFFAGLFLIMANAGSEIVPLQPVAIEKGVFQYFLDDYLIENRFDDKFLVYVRHFVHEGKQDANNPLLIADKPWEIHGLIGPASVIYDKEEKLFRAYYHIYEGSDKATPARVGYAESKDGVHWVKPEMNHYLWNGEKTNIVLQHGEEGASTFQIVDIPDDKKNGHNFLGYYIGPDGGYLAGSQNGTDWETIQKILSYKSDCQHSVIYDKQRDEFLIYFRNVLQFHQTADNPKSGTTRVISRIASKELFTLWKDTPKAVILPDGKDAILYYGMPTTIRDNVYFGFLEQFDLYPHETIDVELRTSRNGLTWKKYDNNEYRIERGRYKFHKGGEYLIARGEYGEWNGGMVKPAGLVEYGDEWLLYYTGFEGYHSEALKKKSSLGLLRFRKEGFVSVRSHESRKSYVITRPLIWPGGQLKVNFDGTDVFPDPGSLKVRVVDVNREPIEGFSYEDCQTFEGDDVRAEIRWKNADIASLEGKEVRLEFEFQRGDLFGFIAE